MHTLRKVFDRIVIDRSLSRRRIVIYRKLDSDEEFVMNVNKMMILCLVPIKISVLELNSPTSILWERTVA